MRRALRDESGVAALVIAAIIIVIAAAAFSGFVQGVLKPAGLQERTSINATKIPKVVAALQAYAVHNGRLPCPAVSAADGTENAGACPSSTGAYRGVVPWVALGLSRADVEDAYIGRYLTYGVSGAAVNNACPGAVTGNLQVDGNGPFVAVIVSHGENGAGATGLNGSVVAPSPPANSDEAANAPDSATPAQFADPGTVISNDAAGNFDDMLRAIAAGDGRDQIKFCTDELTPPPLEQAAQMAGGDSGDLTCAGGTCTGEYALQGIGAGSDQETVNVRGSGDVNQDGGDGSLGVAGGTADVDAGETLTIAFERQWRQFALVAILNGGTAAADREITVTGYRGSTAVGRRILRGAAAAGTYRYVTLGFAGSDFTELRLTTAGPGSFRIAGFAVCGGEVFPCTPTSLVAIEPMPTAAMTITDGSARAAVTFGDSAATDFTLTMDADPGAGTNLVPVLCSTTCPTASAGGIMAVAGTVNGVSSLVFSDGTGDVGELGADYFQEDANGDAVEDFADLTNAAGDLYYHATGDDPGQMYRSRMTPVSPNVAYAPELITDGINPLVACGSEAIIAINDTAFFEASHNGSDCGLWRMRRSDTAATRVVLETADGYLDSPAGNYFVAQNRLYFTEEVDGAGIELYRVSPGGAVSTFNVDGAATDSNPTNFSVIGDDFFFTANDLLYVIYDDSAAGNSTGGVSTTAHPVSFSTAGGAAGQAPASTAVVGTYDADAEEVRYFVQSDRSGGAPDIFSFAHHATAGPTGTGTAMCLGASALTARAVAANGGHVYYTVERSALSGTYDFYDAVLDDFGATCAGGGDGTQLTMPGIEFDLGGLLGLNLFTSSTPLNPASLARVHGPLDSTVNGGVYFTGATDYSVTIVLVGTFSLPLVPAGTYPLLYVPDAAGDTIMRISSAATAMTTPPSPGQLKAVNDSAYFSALRNAGGQQRFYVHAPTDDAADEDNAVQVNDIDGILPMNFVSFDQPAAAVLSSP